VFIRNGTYLELEWGQNQTTFLNLYLAY